MKRLQLSWIKSTKGQSLVEYGLVLALVAVVAIGGLGTLGTALKGILSGLSTEMSPSVSAAQGGVTPKENVR